MPTTPVSLRLPSFNALSVLAVSISVAGLPSAAMAAGPFDKFLGSWSGAGQMIGTNGHRESIRCRAEYTDAKSGSALNQTIVCASESFKLDIQTYAEASGELGPGILEGSLARRVRASDRTYFARPLRRRIQRPRLFRCDLAHVQRPDADCQYQATRRRHFRRAH